MIVFPVAVLAVSVGIVLAAVESPYAYDRARTNRLTVVLVGVGAVIAAGGALVMRNWSPG